MIRPPNAGTCLWVSDFQFDAPIKPIQAMIILSQSMFGTNRYLHQQDQQDEIICKNISLSFIQFSYHSPSLIIQRQQSNHSNKHTMQYFDKQNSLSFQNITQTMKIKRLKKQGLCYYHQEKPAKYRDRHSDIPYCTSCAIQEASKGALIEEFSKNGTKNCQIASFLTETYQECQAEIHEYIRTYNNSYQRLIETLTDIQIKDILTFNKKIEQNHATYQHLKDSLHKSWRKEDLRKLFIPAEHNIIINKINQLNASILNLKNDLGGIREKLSPKVITKNQSDFAKSKQFNISSKSLQDKYIHLKQSCHRSFNLSNNNTNSLKSRDNSTVEEIKKSIYEDTPESIKMRLSDNSFKVTNEMAVTMFEKIDVCESIDISNKSNEIGQVGSMESGEDKGRGSFSSLKSRYRYQHNK